MPAVHGLSITLLALAVGALASGPAQGATALRHFVSHPAGTCQGALPAFETAIRKRPLAVKNEGTTPAFVTCSFTSQGQDGGMSTRNPTRVAVYFRNSGAPVTLSCTGVSGYEGTASTAQYVVKSMPLGGGIPSLVWSAADFGEAAYFPNGLFSISCALAPGVSIHESVVQFEEEIGAL